MELGIKVQDKITGFTGTVTGYCQYLTGCHQVLVQPSCREDGKYQEAMWIDEQRLKVLRSDPVVLDTSATPGFDKAPPVR